MMSWFWLLPALCSTLLCALQWRRLHVRQRALEAASLEAHERAAATSQVLAPHALLVDARLEILAVGAAVGARLAPVLAERQARDPQFRLDSLRGRRLPTIHPALQALRGSDEIAELTLDGTSPRLGCRATPLRGASSAPCGHVVEWRDLDAERDAGQSRDQDERRREREALAIESLDAALMLVDAELRIADTNGALRALLAPAAAELAARQSRRGASALVGAPLDLFEDGNFRVDALRAPDAPPQSTHLDLGPLRLKVVATPLRAGDGRFVGAVLRWIDRTEAARIQADIQRVVGEVNRYNLVPRVPLEGSNSPLATLGAGVNQVADTLAGIVSTVTTLARQVSEASADIAGGNARIGEQAERAASSLAETVACTRGMTESLQQLAGNARVASRLAAAMRNSAVQGGEVVHDAREAMSRIDAMSRRMADMVGAIDGIAFQTNLLAVNAAIEAAHAGEHGGGFGVVATEVRALARRSKLAAQEVHAMIDETLRCVAAGSAKVSQSEQALGEIIEAAHSVDAIISEVDSVVVQQSGGIGKVEAAVLELERFTREHHALVAHTSLASGALAEQSADLAGLMRRYKLPEVILNAPQLRARKRPDAPVAAASKSAGARDTAIARLRVASATR